MFGVPSSQGPKWTNSETNARNQEVNTLVEVLLCGSKKSSVAR